MVQNPGNLEAALCEAIGDDPALVRELRAAYLASAATLVVALGDARSAADWRQAAWRLKGLAASFGAIDLMDAADAAGRSAPGDRHAIDTVRAAIR